jgi:hypothetical protein
MSIAISSGVCVSVVLPLGISITPQCSHHHEQVREYHKIGLFWLWNCIDWHWIFLAPMHLFLQISWSNAGSFLHSRWIEHPCSALSLKGFFPFFCMCLMNLWMNSGFIYLFSLAYIHFTKGSFWHVYNVLWSYSLSLLLYLSAPTTPHLFKYIFIRLTLGWP